MKIVGVITEYNPFHYGHQYQLEEIRKQSNCDVLVVLMSGNVVQRGRFAIMDKWNRTEIALNGGADIVFELPLLASLQSADYFAQVGVRLLALLGCNEFYFGVETASKSELVSLLEVTSRESERLNKNVKNFLAQGFSYAAAFQQALNTLEIAIDFEPSLPNHLLAMHYLKTNQQLEKPMEAKIIPRLKEHEEYLVSATQIRQAIEKKSIRPNQIPEMTFLMLNEFPVIDMEHYWPLLQYRLMTHNANSLAKIFGIREGIEHLILEKIRTVKSWNELLNQLTSKRWTNASINRILLAILGDIKKVEWENYQTLFWQKPTIRLLGFKESASRYLKMVRKGNVTIISNWRREFQEIYELHWRLDDVFSMNLSVGIDAQNLVQHPIKWEH